LPCFQSNTELSGAVSSWFQSPELKSTIEGQYGSMGDWCFGAGVTSMARLFQGRSTFNEEIGNWDGSAITVMSDMFDNATSFNQDLSSWDVSATITAYMFRDASSLTEIYNHG
jgi:hypothetical protein